MTDPMPTPPARSQFSLTTVMLVTLVCAMTAAGGRYLVQGLRGGASARALFVVSVLLLPMLLLLGVNLLRLATKPRRPPTSRGPRGRRTTRP